MKIISKTRASKAACISILFSFMALTVAAQVEENTVTIKFDDGEGITGVLVETTDIGLRLDTLMGVVNIPLDGVSCIGAACPSTIVLETEEKPILLTSLDGATKMKGNLLEIVDGQYVLATVIGEMRVPVDQVTCEGSGCVAPVAEPVLGGQVTLTSGNTVLQGILRGLDKDSFLVEVAAFGELRVPRDFDCSGDGCPVE